MSDFRISCLITTYSKLPYLRQVVERLVAARRPDGEIVVADGGSKDGTPEYLRGLYAAGQIQQLVSERRSRGQVVCNTVEAAKRPLRPAKRQFFDRMGWKQVQNPNVFKTSYVPRLGEEFLDAGFRVCDEFMAPQHVLRETSFIYNKSESVTKVMLPS